MTLAAMKQTVAFLRALLAPPLPLPGADDVLPQPHRQRLLDAVAGTLSYLDPELRGAANLPEGGALLVGNHGLMGVDSFALFPLLHRHSGRVPRGLGDKRLFALPYFDRLARRLGAVEGTPDNAVRLLQQGELCLVYPGGAPESFKGPDEHYRLRWHDRFGFIRVALRAQVPIVPVMGAGIDHAYRYLFRDKWVMRHVFGDGLDRYDFPVSLGLGILPLPGKFTFHVGAPMQPPGGPELAGDEAAVRAWHATVWQTAQGQLDTAMQQWHEERGAADRSQRMSA